MNYSEVAVRVLSRVAKRCDGKVVFNENDKYQLVGRLSYFSEDDDGITLRTRFSSNNMEATDYYEKSYKYSDPSFPNNLIEDIKIIFNECSEYTKNDIQNAGYTRTTMSQLLTDEIKDEVQDVMAKNIFQPVATAKVILESRVNDILQKNCRSHKFDVDIDRHTGELSLKIELEPLKITNMKTSQK